ncbi:hypothetical protein ACJMK2_018968 [Sinanodonta woodiana]|uniref:Secreted protein n=1 Tax=Sinanodonta woodiana TaxID=1069815 RepID=A0ABD3UEZ7_SINWO
MTVKLFLCVMFGLSAQRSVESCNNETLNEIRTILDPFHRFDYYHSSTETYSFICSDKIQRDLVKGALKLEPCLEVYMDDQTYSSVFVPYTRRVLKKLTQQYMTDFCQTFHDVLPHTKCIENLLKSVLVRHELLQSFSTCLWTRPSEEPCSIVNVVVDVAASCILDLVEMECPNAKDTAPAFLNAVLEIIPRDCNE